MLRLLLLLILGCALALGWVALRRPAEALDLGGPIGPLTGRNLTALHGDAPACRRLLDRAGIRYESLPPREDGQCGYDDAVRERSGGPLAIQFGPSDVAASCAVAAALATWEWQVVQPAAYRRFGQGVVSVDHFGSYNCRRIAGGADRGWSEHARANAIDVAGFRFADGRRITVARDWRARGEDAAFLREVRDGACRLFATVLSPDYNAAHRDHLHLDQAARGAAGWRACR